MYAVFSHQNLARQDILLLRFRPHWDGNISVIVSGSLTGNLNMSYLTDCFVQHAIYMLISNFMPPRANIFCDWRRACQVLWAKPHQLSRRSLQLENLLAVCFRRGGHCGRGVGIPSTTITAFRNLYNGSRLLKVASSLHVCLSQACMYYYVKDIDLYTY